MSNTTVAPPSPTLAAAPEKPRNESIPLWLIILIVIVGILILGAMALAAKRQSSKSSSKAEVKFRAQEEHKFSERMKKLRQEVGTMHSDI